MIDHELTDPAGGALTITHDHQGVWITATEGRDEVTVGPFPVTSLTEAVTVESDESTDTERTRQIAYHDSFCRCHDDISTYPTPPDDWEPDTAKETP